MCNFKLIRTFPFVFESIEKLIVMWSSVSILELMRKKIVSDYELTVTIWTHRISLKKVRVSFCLRSTFMTKNLDINNTYFLNWDVMVKITRWSLLLLSFLLVFFNVLQSTSQKVISQPSYELNESSFQNV